MSNALEAELVDYPGATVIYGDGEGEYDGMMFDRRCRYCARFVRMPETMGFKYNLDGQTKGFTPVVCSRCGQVEPVFVGWGV